MSDILLTAAQMRALEQAAIESGQVTGLELMERAGRGAVEAILAEWPELAAAPGRAVVLCGPGNNGGDGFVVARLLRERGWEVEVFLYGDPKKLPPDARVNCERWGGMGEVEPFLPEEGHARWDGTYWTGPAVDLAVDALFGIGMSRPMEKAIFRVFGGLTLYEFGEGGPRVVALDVPSGLQADTGQVVGGRAISVHLTVTFHSAKTGHYLAEGPRRCRAVRCVDIGIDTLATQVFLLEREAGLPKWRGQDALVVSNPKVQNADETSFEPMPSYPLATRDVISLTGRPYGPEFKGLGHKYDHGHALVLTGGMGRTGAARLAARGAFRVGAGLVTLGAPGAAMLECAAQITALMLRRCEDADALAELLQDKRLNALCLGPGLGIDARAEGLVAAAVSSGVSAVLDADALTILAGRADMGLHAKCVLTPHGGEFARLFPDLAEKLETPATQGPAYSKVDATREAAARVGAVVLFKGPDTVIAAPHGSAAVNAAVYDRAAPWLATAGSGDVLAGMIAGLLARGAAPFDAACSAAWLHVEAARAFGPGLIAEDLPEMLPKVFAELEASAS